MKLLIVDDHAGVRAMIRQLAAVAAGDVCECACGDDALRAAAAFSPDLITMDVRLPDGDGIAITRQLRMLCPATRVVIVTAYDQPELRLAALDAGAAGFFAKDNLIELASLFARLSADAARSRDTDARG